MFDYNFKEVEKSLSSALIDDFRGFLLEETQRLEVADDDLHALVARNEMEKVPGYKYVSGQDSIIELMKEKRAIYITKIPINADKTEFCRTVSYLKDSFLNLVNYRGRNQREYLVLRQIAIGMEYNVDEYELLEKKAINGITPVTCHSFEGKMKVEEISKNTISFTRSLSEGDKPVFDSQNNLIGFTKNGKFKDVHHYERYTNIHNSKNNNNINSNSREIDKDDELEL